MRQREKERGQIVRQIERERRAPTWASTRYWASALPSRGEIWERNRVGAERNAWAGSEAGPRGRVRAEEKEQTEQAGCWAERGEGRDRVFLFLLFYFVFKTKFNYEPNAIQIEFQIYFSIQIKVSKF